MNRTKRVLVIGLLCVGTSALSFGDIFQSLNTADWDATYTPSTALFNAVIQQDASSLEKGFPGLGVTGGGAGSGDNTFALSYNTATGATSLTIGSETISYDTLILAAAGGGLDHIGIALSTGSADEAITISQLVLNGGTADTGSLTTDGSGLFDFAMTPPSDLTGNPIVTLSGNINLGGASTDALLSATIVGADASPLNGVPEPGTWALLGSALVGLGLLRRKRIV